MEKQSDYIEIDILRILKALWRKAFVIAIAAVICGALAFSYAAFLVEPKYESSALFYVNNNSLSLGSTSFSISSSDLSAAQSLVKTYIVILKSRTTLTDIINTADLHYSYDELSSMISASAINGTEIFKVTVTSADPGEAKEIANTVADVLPRKISDIVDGSSMKIVDYAVIPAGKASPNITKYTVLGVIFGILITGIFVVISDMTDNQVHGTETLPNVAGIPVLAEIPDFYGSGKSYGYHSSGYGKSTGYRG